MSVDLKKFLAGIGTLALLQTAAWAQTVPLVGDTFIMPGGGTNYGSLVNVNVGGPSAFQGLWLFDLTKLPAGTVASNVSGASLRLFVNKIGTAGSINVNVPSGSWSESTANGLPGPGVGQLVAGPISVSVGAAYISIPVTSQVQAWLNGAPNNGFIVTATPSSTSLFFDSKETTATSHPAVLEIDLGGQAGPVGAQGLPGSVGAIGATGPTGATGPQGAAGAAGAAGPTGPTGAVGPAGAVGAAGSQGPPGVAGATGPTGAAGPAGAAGAAGSAGVAGAVGPTGPAGSAGSPGATGAQGSAGAAGAAGAAGRINNNFSYVLLPSAANITIADTETHTNIQVDNVTFEPTILLPHSRVIGAGTVLSISVHDWAVNTNGILVAPQTGDQLLLPAEGHINPIGIVNPGSTWSLNYLCELVSDGNGHWYFLINN